MKITQGSSTLERWDESKIESYGACGHGWKDAQAHIRACYAEIDRLKAALKKYGEHNIPCPCTESTFVQDEDCTCGLTDLLSGKP